MAKIPEKSADGRNRRGLTTSIYPEQQAIIREAKELKVPISALVREFIDTTIADKIEKKKRVMAREKKAKALLRGGKKAKKK